MSDDTTNPSPLRIERTYEAPIEDLWDLWTTKEGFESWWGPEGFRVEVHALDLRVGGELFYDMIAVGAEQIEYMKSMGAPLSHETRCTFAEVTPPTRLKIRNVIDFIPGVEPYETDMLVELVAEGASVRMVLTLDRLHSEEWTQRAAAGWESQLTKLPGALAARARARSAST